MADLVPHVNLISRHVPYDEILPPEMAEQNTFDMAAMLPTGGCLGLGHPPFQHAMLAQAGATGATVRRGVDAVRVTPGASPSVSYERDGVAHTAAGRLVVAADARESGVRKSLGIELDSTQPSVMLAGILVDDAHDRPADQQAGGVADDFNFLCSHKPTAGAGCTGRGTCTTRTASPGQLGNAGSSTRSGFRVSPTCSPMPPHYRMNAFGAEARDRRGRLLQSFLSNPVASLVATMLLGAWALPEEAYSDAAWDVLAGV